MKVVEAVEATFERINGDERDGIWITLADQAATFAAAVAVDRRVAAGEVLPLAGMTLAVKDNIDVSGLPTTAGCPAYTYHPDRDAIAVTQLLAAGAVVVGKTNLDQFATGLVGVRSPYGACPNAHWPGLIAGGSSSGSAVVVAAGIVDIALGTDTAGSGRVPAACNGIVGLKPTGGRIGMSGVVPACRSLDCVSVFARTVDTAAFAAAIAAGPDPADPFSRAAPEPRPPRSEPIRLGVPRIAELTFDGDMDEAGRFGGVVDTAAATGCEIVEIEIAPFVEAGALLYGGAFVAERFEAVGSFVTAHRDEVDPVVGSIIAASGELPAWQVFRDRTELARLRRRVAPVWDRVDAIAVPTIPRIPTVAEVLAEPYDVNTMLGTYTNFVNLLDLAALTTPVGAGSASLPPPSVTFIGPAWSDPTLVAIAARIGKPATLRTR
jgi:allophanate hydrolase